MLERFAKPAKSAVTRIATFTYHCGRLAGYRIFTWGAEKEKKG
jgi:hypothetical protein